METLRVGTGPRLAVIADDNKKTELIDLLRTWRAELESVRLVATRDTGNLIRSRLALDVELVEAGSRGGAYQIAARVVQGHVDAVVDLQQPSLTPASNGGTMALRQVCDIHDVTFASNLATADAVIASVVRRWSSVQVSTWDAAIYSCAGSMLA